MAAPVSVRPPRSNPLPQDLVAMVEAAATATPRHPVEEAAPHGALAVTEAKADPTVVARNAAALTVKPNDLPSAR